MTTTLNEDFERKLAALRDLLSEAYEHYFATSDGHCKSSEGAISVNWPPFFWRDDEPEVKSGPSVSIYSYVLGPHRDHHFATIDEALAEVRKWHAQEMATDHQGGWFDE